MRNRLRLMIALLGAFALAWAIHRWRSDRYDEPQFIADLPGTAAYRDEAPPPYQTRAEASAGELARLEALRDAHGGWEAWNAAVAPQRAAVHASCLRDDSGVMKSAGRLAFRKDQIGVISAPWPVPHGNDPLPMLASLSAQLRANGIDLIVMPCPPRCLVNWADFAGSPPVPGQSINPGWYRALADLAAADVEVIDLLSAIEAEPPGRRPAYFFPQMDEHPADALIRLAARLAAERLRRFPLAEWRNSPDLRRARYTFRPPDWYLEEQAGTFESRFRGEMTYVLNPDGSRLKAHPHRSDSAAQAAAHAGDGSPILVIGDSFLDTFSLEGADFCAHLAFETGVVPRRLIAPGAAPAIQTRLAREGRAFFAGRRVCLFFFNGRELIQPVPPAAAEQRKRWTIAPILGGEDRQDDAREYRGPIKVVAAPAIPAAESLDYASCLGVFEAEVGGQRALVAGWVYRGRQPAAMHAWRAGHVVAGTAIPMAEAAVEVQNAPQIGGESSFDLPLYYFAPDPGTPTPE